jgi:hypothetical protein
MPNAWVEHIKKYAKDNIVSYGCALSMPDCKESYKNNKKKEPQTKESKTKESKPYTKYDTPIGPVKPKVTKPYSMYEKPIGPVKPKETKPMYDKPIGHTYVCMYVCVYKP